MAVQQNKKSASKRGMHRAHNFLTNPPLAVEPVSGEAHLRHHVSPSGYLPRQEGRQDQDGRISTVRAGRTRCRFRRVDAPVQFSGRWRSPPTAQAALPDARPDDSDVGNDRRRRDGWRSRAPGHGRGIAALSRGDSRRGDHPGRPGERGARRAGVHALDRQGPHHGEARERGRRNARAARGRAAPQEGLVDAGGDQPGQGWQRAGLHLRRQYRRA